MDDQFHNFCSNLRILRKSKNLTQKELASRLNISLYSLRKLEQEEIPKNIKIDILFSVSKLFGVPVHLLFSPILLITDEQRHLG